MEILRGSGVSLGNLKSVMWKTFSIPERIPYFENHVRIPYESCPCVDSLRTLCDTIRNCMENVKKNCRNCENPVGIPVVFMKM